MGVEGLTKKCVSVKSIKEELKGLILWHTVVNLVVMSSLLKCEVVIRPKKYCLLVLFLTDPDFKNLKKRYSCGYILGPHEPIPTKFGLWMSFIMLHWYMVSKMLECKKSFFCHVITSALYCCSYAKRFLKRSRFFRHPVQSWGIIKLIFYFLLF